MVYYIAGEAAKEYRRISRWQNCTMTSPTKLIKSRGLNLRVLRRTAQPANDLSLALCNMYDSTEVVTATGAN